MAMTHIAMTMGSTALWLMLLLGAFHGINPGMGWLFAVALGMQERKGSAVARALVPIALGHALAVGSVVMAAVYLGMALPQNAIRYFVAAILFSLGIYLLVGHHHPRWIRMQVGFRDLTLWSFLMASAHGAGLMVLPVLLGASAVQAADSMPGHLHAPQRPVQSRRCLPRRSYGSLSCGHGAGCVGGLHQARTRDSPDGMAQPEPGMGRSAGCHGTCHPDDLVPPRGGMASIV